VTQSITDLRGLTGSPIASPTFIVHRETPTITAAAAEPEQGNASAMRRVAANAICC